MSRLLYGYAAGALLTAIGVVSYTAMADETSTGDKLRILYSNRFTFSDDGTPLVTVEITSGRDSIKLSADRGLLVMPDGDGGAEIQSGSKWRVHVENSSPALIHDWTVIGRFESQDEAGISAAVRKWEARGLAPRRFEVGTIFGVEGEVIDSREVLVGVAPVHSPGGGKKARYLAKKYKLTTSVHHELVSRPQGVIVATSGDTVIRNPSVIWFAPRSDRGSLWVDNVEVGGGGSQLKSRFERRHYFGRIYVTLGNDGQLVAVNAVGADRLLAGLVPSEIFPSAHTQALRAQAIAARTELLEKIGTRHGTDPFLLCSTQHCQVYSGAGREHPRTSRAVAKTRGMILLRDGGGVVDARYSATCGGHSEHNDYIWGGDPDPSLRGHLDHGGTATARFRDGITADNLEAFLAQPAKAAYCGSTRFSKKRYRWTKRMSASALSSRVAAKYPLVGRVRALIPLLRGVSGRIGKIRIVGARGSVVASGDLHIRRLLGGLRSTLFAVDIEGDKKSPTAFVFRGAGFGHGVGMCQIGAVGMADAGHKHSAILQHYYPGSHLKRLY